MFPFVLQFRAGWSLRGQSIWEFPGTGAQVSMWRATKSKYLKYVYCFEILMLSCQDTFWVWNPKFSIKKNKQTMKVVTSFGGCWGSTFSKIWLDQRCLLYKTWTKMKINKVKVLNQCRNVFAEDQIVVFLGGLLKYLNIEWCLCSVFALLFLVGIASWWSIGLELTCRRSLKNVERDFPGNWSCSSALDWLVISYFSAIILMLLYLLSSK